MTHNPGFLALVNDAKKHVRETNIDGYRKMVDGKEKHILVDVREDNEWAASHAAGAVHMSKGIIERDIETKVPDKNATLVLYCGGGFRSMAVGAPTRNPDCQSKNRSPTEEKRRRFANDVDEHQQFQAAEQPFHRDSQDLEPQHDAADQSRHHPIAVQGVERSVPVRK
jgi:hypothetical protein